MNFELKKFRAQALGGLATVLKNTSLNREAKVAIVLTICGPGVLSPTMAADGENARAFWTFYNNHCATLGNDSECFLETHKDLMNTIETLRLNGDASKSSIIMQLQPWLSRFRTLADYEIERYLDAAATIMTMAEIGSHTYPEQDRAPLPWPEDQTLRNVISEKLSPKNEMDGVVVRLEGSFHARALERIGGLHLRWTNNILDHLRLSDDDTVVHIFHNVTFLLWQSRNPSPVIPESVLEETLRTLALLFPNNKKKVREWAEKKVKNCHIDPRLPKYKFLEIPNRQVHKFDHWRDRLIIIKQHYDDIQPKRAKQFLHDRRNGPQFFEVVNAVLVTFLTAVTVIFGIVQIVIGGYQLRYAILEAKSRSQ